MESWGALTPRLQRTFKRVREDEGVSTPLQHAPTELTGDVEVWTMARLHGQQEKFPNWFANARRKAKDFPKVFTSLEVAEFPTVKDQPWMKLYSKVHTCMCLKQNMPQAQAPPLPPQPDNTQIATPMHAMQAYVRARHAICVVKNFPAVIPSERIDTTDRALLRFVVAFLAIANPKFGQMTWQTTFVQAFCKYVLFGTYRAASRGRTKFTMKPVRQHIITAYYDGLSPYSGISRTTFCSRCLALTATMNCCV